MHEDGIKMYIPRTKAATRFGIVTAGGLGVGIGLAQGIKLASPDSQVVVLIGDGCFNYNPVTACLWASREYDLPIMMVIYDNQAYEAMGDIHLLGYPKGWGKKANILPGAYLRGYDYIKLAEAFGFYGTRVDDPSAVQAEVAKAYERVRRGTTAIVDVRIAKTSIPEHFKSASFRE